MPSRDQRFTICGKTWLWRYARLVGRAAGWTIWPDEKSKDQQLKILIDSSLRGSRRLEIEIHEFLHAANPSLSEDHVAVQAKDLSVILWKLCYRIEKKDVK